MMMYDSKRNAKKSDQDPFAGGKSGRSTTLNLEGGPNSGSPMATGIMSEKRAIFGNSRSTNPKNVGLGTSRRGPYEG